jgi:lysophospholipase L1-like esterase
MKYFYFYAFGLACFIIFMSLYNSVTTTTYIEEYANEKRNFILMGDSILRNNIYVPKNENVAELLKKHNINVVNLAENNAIISDVYNQISYIPDSLYNKIIFLSIGGNDILSRMQKFLSQIEEQGQQGQQGQQRQLLQRNNNNNRIGESVGNRMVEELQTIFTEYTVLVETVAHSEPDAQLYLFNLFYPRYAENINSNNFRIVQTWNDMLFHYIVENPKLNMFRVSSILTKPEDFVNGIEPSSIGGEKIVQEMIKIY